MPNMNGKTVLITGANQGIGKASAIALGKMGAKLVLVCRSKEKARAAIAEIEKAGAKNVELILGDLGSLANVRRVAKDFLAKHTRLDVLLNNAGLIVPSRRTTGQQHRGDVRRQSPRAVPADQPAVRRAQKDAGRARGHRVEHRAPQRAHALGRPAARDRVRGHEGVLAVEAVQHPLHARASPGAWKGRG